MNISSWLKRYFIPHDKNRNRPHLLRRKPALAVAGGVLAIELLFLAQMAFVFPNVDFFAAILNSVLVGETNNARIAHELSAVAPNSMLAEAARLKAEDMAARGYFSHIDPDGRKPWYWLEQVGYDYSYAGENLAVGFFDSEDAVQAWMDSPTHRENILNARFTEMGIGTAKGEYKGRQTTFVVQMFARPPSAVPAVAANEPREIVPAAVLEAPMPEVKAMATEQAEQKVEQNSLRETAKSAIASPRRTTNYLFILLAAIIGIALALAIGINVKVQHPGIIAHGVLLLVIIASAIALNNYLAYARMELL